MSYRGPLPAVDDHELLVPVERPVPDPRPVAAERRPQDLVVRLALDAVDDERLLVVDLDVEGQPLPSGLNVVRRSSIAS